MIVEKDGIISAALSLTVTTIGAGVLAIPLSFQEGGIALGIGFLTLIAVLTVVTIDYLIVCVVYLGLKSYEDISRELLGRTFEHICRWILILYYVGIAAGYVVVVREIFTPLSPVLAKALGVSLSGNAYATLVWLFFMTPITCIPDIKYLHSVSFLAILTTFLVSALIIYRYFCPGSYMTPLPLASARMFSPSRTGMLALPVLCFSCDCQTLCFQLYANLRRPSRRNMLKVTSLSLLLTSIIYGSVGVYGYLSFGDAVNGNILTSYLPSKDVLLAFGQITYTVTIVLAYALLLIPCRDAVHNLLFGFNSVTIDLTQHRSIRTRENVAVCFLLSLASYLISLRASSIAFLIAFLGGACSSVMCFCFPAAFRIMMHSRRLAPCTKLELVSVYAVFIFGVVAGVLGTYVALLKG